MSCFRAPPRIVCVCLFVWLAGFLLVPLLFVLNFERDVKLPPQWLDIAIILTAVICSLAVGFAPVSQPSRIGLFLATIFVWLIVFVGLVHIYAGFIF
jgi:hypothetical protein